MKKIKYLLFIPLLFIMVQCTKNIEKTGDIEVSPITEQVVQNLINQLTKTHDDEITFRAERGVRQTARLWRNSDGSVADFEAFCQEQFVAREDDLETLFNKLSDGIEILSGYFLRISKDLMRPLHLNTGPITFVDQLFGAYQASAHLSEDLFVNKIAFIITLNFPEYSLAEKSEKGSSWTRREWAFARMGDVVTSRVPASYIQDYSTVSTNADTYISEYNIAVGYLVNNAGNTLFPENKMLINHWGLRDELKSQYSEVQNGLEKQKMIYQVMKRIIDQSIPEEFINSKEYKWDPYTNKISKDGKEVELASEPDTRYEQVQKLFIALKNMDRFHHTQPTYIQRKFEGSFEIPVDEVESIFIALVSSNEVRNLARLISSRLGRPLEPFDIWYDGFKARSGIPAERLDAAVSKRFTNAETFEKEIPSILTSLGWNKEKAEFFKEKIRVEGARGAGHAWGGAMRSDVALLRTRIPDAGMDYKGFNIAMHEFGHTIEQTITLHDVDYYMLNGVPNTAFTEALAFIFQKRDLDVLGIKETGSEKDQFMTLDILWACYEIMGVSLVDIRLWKWLYENPGADKSRIKEATIGIAKDVWNQYFADVFGTMDEPILAIYSHMIDNPLYLSAYPLGHLISFQLENQITDKSFASEVQRIFQHGRIIPQLWMKEAVGNPLSISPLLEASSKAITEVDMKK